MCFSLRGNMLMWKIFSRFKLIIPTSANPSFSHSLLHFIPWYWGFKSIVESLKCAISQHNRCFLSKMFSDCTIFSSVQSLSRVQLCDLINHSSPGLPVHHQLPESTQTHVHWVGDAIQPSHPLSSPSPPAINLSQHQGLFKWVSSLHQVTKVLEFQLQHQSFQWTSKIDLP